MTSSKTREVLWLVLQDLADDLVEAVADFVHSLLLRHVGDALRSGTGGRVADTRRG